MRNESPVCIGCGKTPNELPEYDYANTGVTDPVKYVVEEEGTYNPANGHFACDKCYIKMGQPSAPFPNRWVAP